MNTVSVWSRKRLVALPVPLPINVAGQVQTTPLLGCPTVLLSTLMRPCERSVHPYARVTRTRVLFISLVRVKVKNSRTVGYSLCFNCSPLSRQTLQ